MPEPPDSAVHLERLASNLDSALDKIEATRPFAKNLYQGRVYDLALRVLKEPGGVEALYTRAHRFDRAGLFHGGDWAHPDTLQPSYVSGSLRGQAIHVAIECLSELRMLAIARGDATHPDISAEEARAFLEKALALNLDLVFPEATEATRALGTTPLMEGVRRLLIWIAEALGTEGVLEAIVDEAERVLAQRPIFLGRVKEMLALADRSMASGSRTEAAERTRRLVTAMRGPSELSRAHPDPARYADALTQLDEPLLTAEATALARSMRATGLVCPQHATLLRHLEARAPQLVPNALELDDVGRGSLDAFRELIARLIERAIEPATAQTILGLACMLEQGVLFNPPVAPSLWRLLGMPVLPDVAEKLERHICGAGMAPDGILLSGVVRLLGQPLGITQGDHPTCQAARAISLWAQCDVGSLLELITDAARDGDIDMSFEGEHLRSSELEPGLAGELDDELDPVSLVLVPHLDRIYAEMWRRVEGRGLEGHKWVNPEFHGWWVNRGFATAIQMGTGAVYRFEEFVRLFYATYHPHYNITDLMTYPQPAGIAATDPHGSFLGWHAITIQRVVLDADHRMRVYFYNPNTHRGQEWGAGVHTSTGNHGEEPGESSLPFEEFAAWLYVFHYNLREIGDPGAAPDDEVQRAIELARETWASDFVWADG